MLSSGQNIDSIKISTQSAFNYDRCNNEDGKIRTVDDTTLTHSDSTKCFNAYVMATNQLGIFYITEFDLTGTTMFKGFVIAIKHQRKLLGISLKPKKCCYKKFGTWKTYNNFNDPMHNNYILTAEINYKNDGPIVLDNLKIQYADLQEYYYDSTAKTIDN
jgi:hypothetical protein